MCEICVFMYENLIFIHETDDFLCANCNFVCEVANCIHENLIFVAANGILKVVIGPLVGLSFKSLSPPGEMSEFSIARFLLNLD